jgi:hypothetical protein
MADYITFNNSNGSLRRQFYATAASVSTGRQQAIEPTLGGSIDLAWGLALRRYNFTIAAPQSASGTIWGTYANLETYYGYNNPGGTPSVLLTMIDHSGGTHTGYLTGDLKRDPLSVILDGNTAYWAIPVQFVEKP